MNSKKKTVFSIILIIILLLLLITIIYFYTKKNSSGSENIAQMGSGQAMQGNGASSSSVEASGNFKVTDTESLSGNYASTTSDESAILVTDGGDLTLKDSTITKTGDTTNTENSEFYGINAAILAKTKGTINIDNANITTNASGANAVFATGENAIINIINSTITTSQNSSRGLDATYGGIINADNVKINTAGAHCAAVATDRGEGTITAQNSVLNTSGEGSPCIYSTGNITVSDSTGDATGSSIAVIEGKNSITLTGCNLTASGMGRATGGIDNSGVMIYQSMSGDAGTGTGTFTATDSTLTISNDSSVYNSAPMFLSTNTDAIINLQNVILNYGSGILLNATGNTGEWGNAGSNGADVTLNADNQNLVGDITCDSISSIILNLKNNSIYKGAIDNANTGNVCVNLDSSSSLELASDCYVTSITDDDSTLLNINSNGYTLYYDSSNSSNSWLNGQTIELSDGGYLKAM